MRSTRLFVGLTLVFLAISQAALAQTDQAPHATSSAAPTTAGSASAPAVTIAKLQAENRDLKAEVARLSPPGLRAMVGKMFRFESQGIWYLVGFFGQFVFFMRFVVQWIATEREKKSVVPVAFWYLSLAGSLITIVYSIYRRDPVFTIAFCLNIFIYMRNLYFIHRKPRAEAAG